LISGGVLPGSIIDARVLKSRKDHILAQCVHIHDIGSEYQIDTVQCPHYFFHPGADPHNHKIGCGGCKWQIIPYPQQLLLKYQVISDTFHLLQDIVDRIGIFPVIPSPESF
jgi:23S rRNA (uracil1939-C5)-methyltransferase